MLSFTKQLEIAQQVIAKNGGIENINLISEMAKVQSMIANYDAKQSVANMPNMPNMPVQDNTPVTSPQPLGGTMPPVGEQPIATENNDPLRPQNGDIQEEMSIPQE